MKRWRWQLVFVAMLAAWPLGTASAQSAGGGEAQLGMRLFNQSCRVCHSKPQLTSPQYAPVLSMNTLGGKGEIIHEVIANGTPRMPGFKYHFTPAQIDAVVAYIKIIPAPSDAPPAAAKPGAGASREAD